MFLAQILGNLKDVRWVVPLLFIFSLGCAKGASTRDGEGSDVDAGSGGGGGIDLSQGCTDPAGSATAFVPTSNGMFVENPVNNTISKVTFYFRGTVAADHVIRAEAFECGFGGPSRGYADATIEALPTAGAYKEATFTFIRFASPNPATSGCANRSVVAFKFTVLSGGTPTNDLMGAGVSGAGTSCVLKTAADAASTPPLQQGTSLYYGKIWP